MSKNMGRNMGRKLLALLLVLSCFVVGVCQNTGVLFGERLYAMAEQKAGAGEEQKAGIGEESKAEKGVEQKTEQGAEQKTEQGAEQKAEKKIQLAISSKSAVLMEMKTGKVIYAQKEEEELMLASVTKIMTLLLIYEAMDAGKFEKEDVVTVSAHAAGMGGSQVFLEEGEKQSVETMIKCIVISSANDAATAMAEFVAGSEEEFVRLMNEKAAELGMEHTKFSNCCGLDDNLSKSDHYSCAKDIAIMSAELLNKYPQVTEYTTVWMDTITHVTKRGESEFGLTNTNKLIRFYDGITGLKTGSTGKAGFCLSASATRNDLSFIAVVMGAKSSKDRFSDASKLLDYGFANMCMYQDDCINEEYSVAVSHGKEKAVTGRAKENVAICLMAGEEKGIKKELVLCDKVKAPVKSGETLGTLTYTKNEEVIKEVPILATEDVEEADFLYYLDKISRSFFMIMSKIGD